MKKLNKTCMCRAWLLSSIPCCYDLTVMKRPIKFVHEYCSTKKLRNTHMHTLQSMNGSNRWAPSQHDSIVVPNFKKKRRDY